MTFISIVCWLKIALLVNVTVAQTPEPSWALPMNVSQSGATNAPIMFRTVESEIYVLWQDEVAETFFYTRGNGETWSTPTAIETPFGTRIYDTLLDENDPTPLFVPWLLAGNDGHIHAFWVDEDERLYYSNVAGTDFPTFSAWTPRQLVANSAIAVTPVLDGDGRLHIFYVQSESSAEFPAGVYYTQYVGEEEIPWSAPILINQSPYFRTMSRNDVALDAGASQVGMENYLYVTWDNRSLDKIFFTRSVDDGQSWESLLEIDGRAAEDDPAAIGPARMQLNVDGARLLLLWEAGHEGPFCTLSYQWSEDGGSNWQPRQQLLAERQACPQRWQFVGKLGDLQLLLLNFDRQSSMLAWDGSQWSNPQSQPLLDRFTDPVTNRQIDFQWQYGVTINDGIVIMGQDAEQNKDVWLLGGTVGSAADWFPLASPWTDPAAILYSQTDIANLDVATGANGWVHVIWTQEDESGNKHSAIYYARWDGTQWTLPLKVLQSPSGERAEQPHMTVTGDGRVLVVWRSETGELLFSQAASDTARIPTEWSQIQVLPTLTNSVGTPMLAMGQNARIYVMYALTLNENRGIYYIYSDDNGSTWSNPVQIFDAVAAQWDMLDQAQLTITGDGNMQAIWSRYSLPPASTSQGVYYSLSVDNGESWSEVTPMTQLPVQWSSIVSYGESIIHRVWQESGSAGLVVWHDYSLDGGLTFLAPRRIPGLEGLLGPVDLATDSVGQLHLILASKEMLWYRWWNGVGWGGTDDLQLADDLAEGRLAAGLALAPNDTLMSLFSGEAADPASGELVSALFSTQQNLAVPEVAPTSLPIITSEPTVSTTATAVSQPTSTPTTVPDLSNNNLDAASGLTTADNDILRLAMVALPVLFLILIIFGIGLRSMWLGRR